MRNLREWANQEVRMPWRKKEPAKSVPKSSYTQGSYAASLIDGTDDTAEWMAKLNETAYNPGGDMTAKSQLQAFSAEYGKFDEKQGEKNEKVLNRARLRASMRVTSTK
jgi:hypothetical protein